MDEREKRRLAHLKRLEADHAKDYAERFDKGKSLAQTRNEAVTNAISSDWNQKQKGKRRGPDYGKPLPEGWRDAHWKTLQAMAAEYAGVDAKNKDESLNALEAYEAELAETAA